MTLTNSNKQVVSLNDYWLSTSPDVLDWANSNWYQTPQSAYADYSLLQTLPAVTLDVTFKSGVEGTYNVTTTTVTNPSNSIAFFIHLRVQNSSGRDIWPIFFDDNYFTLLPKESRVITAKYNYDDQVTVLVDLWNNISGGK